MDTNLKLKVMVTYTWEENVDVSEYSDYISNIREHYILTGGYLDRINKLDEKADNCLPGNYKCSINMHWEE